MLSIEQRDVANRALTAIVDAGIAMRRHKGAVYATNFLLSHGVPSAIIGRALNGPARHAAHRFGPGRGEDRSLSK